MKTEYWDVSDDQVLEKTGHNISYWMKVLKDFKPETKKSNEAVALLQNTHGVPRYWARTLTTRYLKKLEQ
jgi:Domain of unknown function (DUF4287)